MADSPILLAVSPNPMFKAYLHIDISNLPALIHQTTTKFIHGDFMVLVFQVSKYLLLDFQVCVW